MDRVRFEGFAFLAAFIACVPAANWLIGNLGTVCVPQGPCLIPVTPGFNGSGGLTAPSGVLMVGLALVLRDIGNHVRSIGMKTCRRIKFCALAPDVGILGYKLER